MKSCPLTDGRGMGGRSALRKEALWGPRAFIKHLEAAMRPEGTDLFSEALKVGMRTKWDL